MLRLTTPGSSLKDPGGDGGGGSGGLGTVWYAKNRTKAGHVQENTLLLYYHPGSFYKCLVAAYYVTSSLCTFRLFLIFFSSVSCSQFLLNKAKLGYGPAPLQALLS